MKNKLFEFSKKNKIFLILFLIISLGIFIRIYHFGDWLHFETDQFDDFSITSPAIQNGIENLKLLGPRAGAEELRIGPIYYYIEYIGGKIFGDNPIGHAMPNLILSFLSLPLFYLFAREYFSRTISASLLLLYSTSFYMIQYSRFSWNPNVLPFFILATFYLLLKSVPSEEKNRNIFFIISLTILSIISQLHFNGLFIIVPTFILFLLIRRPRFSMKTWAWAILLSVFVYSPVLLHEFKYDWSNSKLLLKKVSGGESKQENRIYEKIIQNLRYNSGEFFLILTGKDVINSSRPNGYSLGLSCKTCRQDSPWRLLALVFYISSVLIVVWNLFKEKNRERMSFLIISSLWLFIGSAYFISLTLKKLYIYPRFYLVLTPLTFVLLGMIFEKIALRKKIVNNIMILLITILIVKMNADKIADSFWQLNNSEKITVKIETEDVFPNYYRTPLSLHQKITDYIEEKIPNRNAKIFISSESEYEPTYWLLLQNKGYQYFNEFDEKNPHPDGEYFSIQITADKKKNDLSKFTDSFDPMEKKDFGIMNVVYMKPKKGFGPATTQAIKMKQLEAVDKMRSWKDLFEE